MLEYFVKRLLFIIPTLFIISLVSFIIIQLPPGDFMTSYLMQLAEQGELTAADRDRVEALRVRYGLDQPVYLQYLKWISGIILRGDFGYSFSTLRSVSAIVWVTVGNTLILVASSLLFIFLVAFPIGFFSAVRQYSFRDYLFTFFGFLGLATPNFLLALVMLYLGYRWFGVVLGGFYSPEYVDAPWSWAKFVDLLRHLIIPTIVLGTAGTAALIRILRNNLLDELQKPYVMTAKAKGMDEWKLLLKYPVRIAINPFLSTVGWLLPDLFSAAIITSVVLSLPTIGPAYLNALMSQDMYLAGSFVLLLATMTVVGTLISDLLLAVADPRIRYE